MGSNNNIVKVGIASISMSGISLIGDGNLRDVLLSVYESSQINKVSQSAEKVFEKLTSKQWSPETLCHFISGWRSIHGTALFVSGLIIRILRTAKKSNQVSQSILYEVASEIGEIIPEDTGVDDTPHNELFTKFANSIVGNDNWQLKKYSLPSCDIFRDYVKNKRLHASIEEAILTTAVSENWNTGEYTFFANLVCDWMRYKFNMPEEIINEASAYVVVHSGNTELGHFLHAIKAWELYCNASNKKVDPFFAKEVFEKYIQSLDQVYKELHDALI